MRIVPGTFRKHAERSWNIPRKLPRKLPQDSGMRNVPGTFIESFLESFRRLRHAERSFNIPRKLPQVSSMGNVPGTFRNMPRTYEIGRSHPVLHLCSLPFRTDAIPSFFFFFFPLLYLLFSFLFLLRNRPYQADSTTSRPICEVKLPRARVVLRWGTTWEVRVLILLRVLYVRTHVLYVILLIFLFF